MHKRSILIYADGGTGKSTSAAAAAEWFWLKHKKKTRVVNADGGGTRSAFGGMESYVSIWDIDLWDAQSTFQLWDLATKGFWPAAPDIPNSLLLPPFRTWKPCPHCGGDTGGKDFSTPSVCNACKTPLGAGTVLPVVREPINGMEEIGLIVFEGFTACGDSLLRRARDKDTAGTADTVTDGEFKIVFLGQRTYLTAQNYLRQFVNNVRQIPEVTTIWTALEGVEEDGMGKLGGPKGPGKALTKQCIAWFDAVVHLDVLPKKDSKTGIVLKDTAGTIAVERWFYLAPHYPPDKPTQKYDSKVAAPAGQVIPPVLRDCRFDRVLEVLFPEDK